MIEDVLKRQIPANAPFSSSSVSFQHSPVQGEGCFIGMRNKCVLLIDNSPTIRKVVEITLLREGYEIFSFRDGIDAMRWFAGPQARTPDLMLVDLGLPKLDGYDVIQKFKTKPRFARTACIILSQRDGLVDKMKGSVVGASAYMTKPFTTQDLVVAVRTYLSNT